MNRLEEVQREIDGLRWDEAFDVAGIPGSEVILHLPLFLLDPLVLLLPGLVAQLVRGEQVTPRVRGDPRPAVDDWG